MGAGHGPPKEDIFLEEDLTLMKLYEWIKFNIVGRPRRGQLINLKDFFDLKMRIAVLEKKLDEKT